MTAAQRRIRAIRLMEKMEKASQRDDSRVTKTEDGTLQYRNDNGDVLFEAKMEGSSK